MTSLQTSLNAIQDERSKRFQFLKNADGSTAVEFMKRVTQLGLDESIKHAWRYAQTLDYHHEGLSKEMYLAHPLRVALLYLDVVKKHDSLGVRLALLHNILEVSAVPLDLLTQNLGQEISDAIITLTVDRSLQWDDNYKDDYYRRITESPIFVQQVKILDKLDNLFILCLNPSDEIRAKYLNEIERWLLPLASHALPAITDYIVELIKNNRSVGHIPL